MNWTDLGWLDQHIMSSGASHPLAKLTQRGMTVGYSEDAGTLVSKNDTGSSIFSNSTSSSAFKDSDPSELNENSSLSASSSGMSSSSIQSGSTGGCCCCTGCSPSVQSLPTDSCNRLLSAISDSVSE
eukprot:CAMPEP_0117043240 /NCGR_PEP_ID=MMETSP0472-20121206/30075_1 /TAXON_ID=693140 ORGANISM="Tiarina fusus, Strain LIS" /NCGR_SAMPLE_ID=MMETSP0472 /ASSEMBLY_ACC=CAM_ASM_000603 /LENGTH=126 /DNA_ID=CAMNT_0004754721 /DNA_START=276 /DNA_END=656 /DNA_ORIENTATION=+